MLLQLEERREWLMATAREQLHRGQAQDSLHTIQEAEQLSPVAEIQPLRALAHLLNRDFANALAAYRSHTST
jgi:hypothetical protein